MNAIGQPTMAVRKFVIGFPVSRSSLKAVIDLDVAEKATVEVGGAKVDVRQHVRLADVDAQLVPRAPSGRHRESGDALPVHLREGRGG